MRELEKEGVTISTISLSTATLDDVFLEKTGRSLEGGGDAEDAEGDEAGATPPVPEPSAR